jgi:hypothetical protein
VKPMTTERAELIRKTWLMHRGKAAYYLMRYSIYQCPTLRDFGSVMAYPPTDAELVKPIDDDILVFTRQYQRVHDKKFHRIVCEGIELERQEL